MSLSVFEIGNPECEALVHGETALTYGELAGRVARVAAMLADFTPASRIAFVAEPTEACVVLVQALFATGHVAVPIHPRWSETERERWVELVRPSAFVRDVGALVAEEIPVDRRRVQPSEEGALAILSTSGTSGTPKPAVLSRRAFVASARAASRVIPLDPTDRWLLSLPLAHVGGLSIVTRSLLAESAIVLGQPGPFDPHHFVATAQRERITFVSVVPAMLHAIANAELRAPSSLRTVLVGGAAASPELLDRARALGYPVRATYGLTEACSQVATDDEYGRMRPVPGIEVAIVEGTIRVSGPTLFDGYLDDGRLERPSTGGWFDTGDLGELRDGVLHVLGRRDDRIVTGGENVDPLEVERVLERRLRTRACVFGVPDPAFGQVVCTAIERPVADDEIDRAAAELAPFKRPRRIFFVDAIPEIGAGKPDRRRAGRLFADKAPDRVRGSSARARFGGDS